MSPTQPFHIADRRAIQIITVSWVSYALIFQLGYGYMEALGAALILIPIFVSAWFGGMAYAMLAAMVSFSFNTWLFILASVPQMEVNEHLTGNIVVLAFAIGVGYIGETRNQLTEQIEERRQAETRLATLNTHLDEQVKRRTQKLKEVNQQLKLELDQRRSAEFEVNYREAILAAVASVGETTLKSDSWAIAIPDVLQELGQAAHVNRTYLFQNRVGERGQIITSQIAEWNDSETESHADDPKLQDFDFRGQGFGRWEELLSQGKIINSDTADLPAAERDFLVGQEVDSILIVPIMTGFDWWGSIGFDSVGSRRIWSSAEIEALGAAASIIGAGILREDDYERTLLGWAKALELRDEETEGHTQRVTRMTVRLAESLGCVEHELVNIRRGSLLHDIGKMGIPDEILRKDGPLNEQEWQIMRRHPIYARDMLAPVLFLAPAITIPFSHHERWDGSGYPLGLKGKDIPFAARIFAIVDVWDALTSDRPYRDAWPDSKVVAYIKDNSGTLFDPEIVPYFFEMLEKENREVA